MRIYIFTVLIILMQYSIFAQVTQFSIEDFGFPSAFNTHVGDINDSTYFTGQHVSLGGYVWKDGVIVIGTDYIPEKINNDNQVIGTYQNSRAFVWQNNSTNLFPFFISNAYGAGGFSINENGITTGYEAATDPLRISPLIGNTSGWTSELPIILPGFSYVSTDDINISGVVVGMVMVDSTTGNIHPVRWVNGSIEDLFSGDTAWVGWARVINDSGLIAGVYSESQGTGAIYPFSWKDGQFNALPFVNSPPAAWVNGINNNNIIVGSTRNSNNVDKGCLWMNDSLYFLEDLLVNGSGWIITDVLGINNKNEMLVVGTKNGVSTTAIVRPAGLKIERPMGNVKWIAGETDTIKWSGGEVNQNVIIEVSVDSGLTFDFQQLVNGEDGKFDWKIPDTLLSKKSMIRIYDFSDTTNADTSDVFRIKGYVLTRDSSGQYEPFRPSEDQWAFWNDSTDMWPFSWYQQFDYRGVDPFTNSQYSQWQGNSAFKNARSLSHPDWVSWVNTFSINACYHSTLFNIYNETAVVKWNSKRKVWLGSCFGIAAASSLAFTWKDQFVNKYPNYPTFQNPITVTSNIAVKKVVNELFTHQYGNPTVANDSVSKGKTVNQTLSDLRQMLIEDDVQPKTISIFGSGGHTILPYRLRRDPTQANIYYLDVYDNSNPTSNIPITIDTTLNSNNGRWNTPDWPGWNGKFYLEIVSDQYLNGVTFPKGQGQQSPFILAENELEINYPSDSQIEIRDLQGNITGFVNNQVYEQIPGSLARMIKNGSEGPPYGYLFETDSYSVKLDQFEEDTVETYFFTGNISFVYEREGADLSQTDRLFFDGGLSAVNPDAQSKAVQLLNIINETTQEKLTILRSIELAQNDSVKIENPDSNTVKLISYGSAKDYDIELNYPTANGIGRFGDFNVQLSENTSHTFVPEWTDITNTDLMVLVDNGNDGTIDDTLYLQNQVTGIEGDQGSLLSPNSYNLAQNYPNPFNPITTIQYSIPKRSNVVLKVYDILGNEIAELVNEEKGTGVYIVSFDASGLASGIYFYKLQVENFVETKKMILLK